MPDKKLHIDVCEEPIYKSLFFEYSKGIRNFIYSKSGNLEVSEDIMQDTFLKLWEMCKDIIFEKSKSFLYTTANNLFIDKARRKKVEFSFRQTKEKEAKDFENPEYKLELSEFKQKLDAVLKIMPEKSREVFLMNRIEKLKYREIAERLNLSVKAIEKRMGIALKIFYDKIKK